MILIISVCTDELSELEFVKPVEKILKNKNAKFFTRKYLGISQDDLNNSETVIICGTALKDFDYLENIDRFAWLKDFEKPVLGICAGAQIIGKIFEGDLISKTMIGKFKVKVKDENKLTNKKEFYSYFLSTIAVKAKAPLRVLAKSGKMGCIIKHETKEVYGCLFHPEVLNSEIIRSFCT